ncbi:MAG: GntR family transcriptional regulator [Thiolinea sp.]
MFENEKPIQKDKLHEQVLDRLCTLLREGEFTPGQAVPVSRVSKAFGVSAMPVREALTRLHAVGVLANVSGRSVGVPILSREELLDLRQVRLEVETTAITWAVQNRDALFLKELEAILAGMESAEKSRDVRSFIKYNYDFHFRFYQQSKSPVLIEIINTLWLRVSPHLHLYHLNRTDGFQVSNKHHHTMVEAARNGNAEAAANALIADVTEAYDDLLAAQDAAENAS